MASFNATANYLSAELRVDRANTEKELAIKKAQHDVDEVYSVLNGKKEMMEVSGPHYGQVAEVNWKVVEFVKGK